MLQLFCTAKSESEFVDHWLEKMQRGETPDDWDNVAEEFRPYLKLLQQMLNPTNPEQRPSAEDVVEKIRASVEMADAPKEIDPVSCCVVS